MSFPPPNYIACFPLQAYFVDRDTGLPLSGGYINFFEDEARTVPKDVFIQQQQPDNSYLFVNIGPTVGLSSVGTTQYLGTDTIIFLYPFDANMKEELYYIQVFSSVGVLQFTREAWPPNTSANFNPSQGAFAGSQNVVSNPQFAEVLIAPAPASATVMAIASATTVQVAPDWAITTQSAGTLSVQQIAVNDTAAPGLPAFALNINSSGFTGNIVLSQTISNSPRLLENGFISGSFIAKADSVPTTVSMVFFPSNPSQPTITVATGTATVGGYAPISGTIQGPQGGNINGDDGNTGYVQVQIILPANSNVTISCVQLVSVESTSIVPNYIQESTPRQKDHLFHYWQPLLNFKPIPSYLVGWDFPLNPAQFGATVAASLGANKSFYAWDQTIVFQSAASGVSVSRESTALLLNLTASATTQMAVIQYLTAAEAKKVLFQAANGGLSVNVQVSSAVSQTMTVSLWWNPNVIGTGMTSNNSLVSALDANGYPTVTANWVEITRDTLGKSTLTTGGSNTLANYGFSNFFDASAFTTGVSFAIVVGTNSVTMNNNIVISSISLVPGEIPTIPAPQAQSQVLQECQYYYEHSYALGTAIIPSATSRNELVFQLSNFTSVGGTSTVYPEAFTIQYDQEKVAIPTITLYPTTGTLTAGNIYAEADYAGGPSADIANITVSAHWTARPIGTRTATYVASNQTPIFTAVPGTTGASGFIALQFLADARLGVV